MTFITSAERHGMEKGRIEGVEIGRGEGMLSIAQEMVLDALDTKFSKNIPSDIEERIKNMTNRLMLKRLTTGLPFKAMT